MRVLPCGVSTEQS